MKRMQSIVTPVAELGYLESGPPDGVPVVLVHGFPDDATTWEPVVKRLSHLSARLFRPFQRGCGPSKVTAPAHEAGGAQVAALARDIVDFADGLGLTHFILVGHDWGSRAAHAAAILIPERIARLICLATAYGEGKGESKLRQLEAFWYQFLFCTDAGVTILKSQTNEFCRYLWRRWSPGFELSEDDFAGLSQSFANPQFADTVIHYYRHRWGAASGAPYYARQQAILDKMPPVPVPSIFVCGLDDRANLAIWSRGNERFYAAAYERHELTGVGHFVQRERPEIVAEVIATSLLSF
jgi:pimeloyl-ACP methyl ester carboxylesterase